MKRNTVMRRYFTLCILAALMAILTVNCSAESKGSWLSDYGIDPNNDCPIFTRPPRTGPDRKEGAGICTNDGAAYNRTYYGLGEDWHYEPKLILCDQEKQAMPTITGKLRVREPLKHGVIPMSNGGALVAYRIFPDSGDYAEHFFATYDHEGNLIDAIALGTRANLSNVLTTEPHGDYTPRENMGGNSIVIDTAAHTLTLAQYNMYNVPNSSSSAEWCDTVTVSIQRDGRFAITSHRVAGKPSVNIIADRAMTLMLLPLSDTKAVEKWNDLLAGCQKNDKAYAMLLPNVPELFVKRTQQFMQWVTANQQRSVLVGALRKALAAADDYGLQQDFGNYVAQSIEACNDPDVKAYWKSLRPFTPNE